MTGGIEMQDLVIQAQDMSLNLTDKFCLMLFPELKEFADMKDMRLASTIGTYIFHEDYFMKYVEANVHNPEILQRFCDYVEYLLSDDNVYLNNLAIVALLERCLDIGMFAIRPLLGEKGVQGLKDASQTLQIDRDRWQI